MTRKRKPKRIVKSFFNKIAALPVKPALALMLKIPELWVRMASKIFAWGFAAFAFPFKNLAIRNLRLLHLRPMLLRYVSMYLPE